MKAIMNVDLGSPQNHPTSCNSSQGTAETSRSSQVVRLVKSNNTRALCIEVQTWRMTGRLQRKHHRSRAQGRARQLVERRQSWGSENV